MENISERQNAILALVSEQGFVATEHLVALFDVTPQTIRRDINKLCEQNLLQRFHGGAGLPVSAENQPYSERQSSFPVSKKMIGKKVADTIHDGASVFINIGTTTEAVAQALLIRKGLRVVTNNLNVAQILSANESFEILITGGIVRKRDGGIVGERAVNFVNEFRLDFGIIGVSGIDAEGALLDFDSRETETAKAIIRNSEKTLLVADHSKFGRRAMVKFGTFSDIDELYTDQQLQDPYVSLLKDADVKIHIASSENVH